MRKYADYSYWLASSGDDLTPRPSLDGSLHVDIAILGAGYSGLWTAYYLKQYDPSLNIVILEAEIAGFGASGRNGGWCVGSFPCPLDQLIDSYGIDVTRTLMQQMYRSVDEIGRVIDAEGIDASYVKPGSVEIARGPHLLTRLERKMETYQRLGLEDNYRLLDADQTRERIRVHGAVGALWSRHGASLHPGALVRGLARAVERKGVRIYERTRVRNYVLQPRPRLITNRGDVWAKAVVLAGEAYLSRMPKLARQIIPVTSHMVVTDPISDSVWESIGWTDRAALTGGGVHGGYLTRTADGRIAFGPFQSVYPFGSRITDKLDRQDEIFEQARQSVYDWFPTIRLHGTQFPYAWGGVLGVSSDRMPTMTYDPITGVATARGYSGQGVATSNLAGRILAELLTGQSSHLTGLPMAYHQSPDWGPEPIRWVRQNIARRGRHWVEHRAEESGHDPERLPLARSVWDR